MERYLVKKISSPKLKNPILIEGLPGVGNVGKIAVDFLIDKFEPTPVCEIYSTSFPHSVFVNDNNLVEMPVVKIYAAKVNNQDLLLLAGDVQPVDEEASYQFSNLIVEKIKELGCKEMITLGGIGTMSEPKNPKIYGAATSKEIKADFGKRSEGIIFNKTKADAIVGATGLLLGIGKLNDIEGVGLIVETFGHQFHIGLKEAKALLKVLKELLNLDIDLKELDEEIVQEEREREKGNKVLTKTVKRMSGKAGDMSYIG
ncbi:MAG: hypothetical protein CXT77_04480 [uncultured DHVE6 group euryarchaeote]|jgi:uncharacterized protein (TIGR00162 family)|nr:MAG: hypothetical protein CXT77_04480 [uncultured DHVE6 group euryarchaeote]